MKRRSSFSLFLGLCMFLLTGCQEVDDEMSAFDSGEESSNEYANVVESEESVTQEEMELLEKINENKIDEQSFEIVLNDWGKVMCVSCMPDYSEDIKNLF